MSAFPDLSNFKSEVDGATLDLPIRGTVYRFSKAIPMRLGLALQEAREQTKVIAEAVAAGAEPTIPAVLGELSEADVQRAMIGDQWDRMEADGITDVEFRHVYLTLFTWHMGGEGPAMNVWTGQVGKGDARPPARSSSPRQTTSPSSSTRKKRVRTKHRRSGGRNS